MCAMTLKEYPELMNPKEVCLLTRLSKPTVYKLIKTGEIKSKRIGKLWFICREQFEKWE